MKLIPHLLSHLRLGTAAVQWLPSFITAPSWKLSRSQLWGEQGPPWCLWPIGAPSSLDRSAWVAQPLWTPSWASHPTPWRLNDFPPWIKGGCLLSRRLRWLSLCRRAALSSALRSGWCEPAPKCKRTSKRVGGRKQPQRCCSDTKVTLRGNKHIFHITSFLILYFNPNPSHKKGSILFKTHSTAYISETEIWAPDKARFKTLASFCLTHQNQRISQGNVWRSPLITQKILLE